MKSFASMCSPRVSPAAVGKSPHAVGVRRRPALGWAPWLALALTACAPSPEALLVGHWREAERREAKQWEFRHDGTLIVSSPGGEPRRARWQLKGRGHLLRLRGAPQSSDEVYEIEKLSRDQLVLRYELGLERRGVARLRFESLAPAASEELAVR